jgi:hypothetical protein
MQTERPGTAWAVDPVVNRPVRDRQGFIELMVLVRYETGQLDPDGEWRQHSSMPLHMFESLLVPLLP